MVEHDETLLTCSSLCNKILDFIKLTPKSSEWSLTLLKSNPPRYYRLKQIDSLANAFGLYNLYSEEHLSSIKIVSELIEQFINGDIVDSIYRNNKLNQQKLANSKILIDINNQVHSNYNIPIWNELLNFYNKIMEYRLKLNDLLNSKDNYLVTNPGISAASNILNLNRNCLVDKKNLLDKIISEIIDPDSQKYTRKELIKLFGYPDVDIWDIDFEYL